MQAPRCHCTHCWQGACKNDGKQSPKVNFDRMDWTLPAADGHQSLQPQRVATCLDGAKWQLRENRITGAATSQPISSFQRSSDAPYLHVTHSTLCSTSGVALAFSIHVPTMQSCSQLYLMPSCALRSLELIGRWMRRENHSRKLLLRRQACSDQPASHQPDGGVLEWIDLDLQGKQVRLSALPAVSSRAALLGGLSVRRGHVFLPAIYAHLPNPYHGAGIVALKRQLVPVLTLTPGMTPVVSDCLARLSQLKWQRKRRWQRKRKQRVVQPPDKHSEFAVAGTGGRPERWRLSLPADRAAGSHPDSGRHKTQVFCIEPAQKLPNDNIRIVSFQPGVLVALRWMLA